jgi:plastocyanin
MFTDNTGTTIKKLTVLFTALFVITFSAALNVFAEEKSVGSIQGIVKAKKAKYIKDSIVYVENVPNAYGTPKEHVVMDQKNMAFIPHVLPLVKGTTVDFLNSDMVQHNIYSPDAVADNMNLGTWLKDETRPFTFNKSGIVTLRCNVHVDMLAYVLVLQNPYFARVNNDGSFSILNVPEGKCRVKLWHERLKAADREVEVKAGAPIAIEFELK